MHPYLVATVVVSVVVVGFVAYTVYNEILNEPIPVYSTTRGNEDDDSEDSDSEKDSYFDPHNNKNTREERIGLRKRKRNTDKKNKDEKNINDSNEQEEQLLEKLSYLNVLEQELHRKEKEIENEERILKEREQQLENRKQYFQSVSSKSSSNSDLSKSTNTSSHETNTRTNTSATNTILDNSSNDENSLSNDMVAVKSVVEQYTLVNESDLHPDAAQTILSQDLSNISGRHLQSSIDDAYNNNHNNNIITTNESDDNNRSSSVVNDEVMDTQQSQLHIFQETLDLPDDSRLLSPNHQSEDAWSEIGSIISENAESEMSSAVDIDMEEVDVIEH